MERKNAWSQYSAEELSRLEAVNEDYKACLDAGKTERECVRLTIERIEKEGYKNLKDRKRIPTGKSFAWALAM